MDSTTTSASDHHEPDHLKWYNLRFLATVASSSPLEQSAGTRIQLNTRSEATNSTEPKHWQCEMSIEQLDKLYNVLTEAQTKNKQPEIIDQQSQQPKNKNQ